ncbi:MAG: F420-dependent NADP oxidoreductase [Spirochaetia bacterium]|nr:F420-dependent NADP oxidoreductase [Spirochaetia bacterium]
MEKITVAVIGAGGKMGTRTSNNLANASDEVSLICVESSEKGIASIEARGLKVTPLAKALETAEVVVFAVPDTLIKTLSQDVVPLLKPNTGFIILDPAAAVAKELYLRDDCTFAVAHPCHPSYFLEQETYEARHDYFGGLGGNQDIVMSKIQGDDAVFAKCRRVSELMYGPVLHSYVMTARQIAFLEPTLVEILGATTLYAMAETVDEAERRGIPREASISFLTGHIYNLSANFLGLLGKTPVSDACKVAMGIGNRLVLRDDWKRIWDDDMLDKSIATMLHPENPKV